MMRARTVVCFLVILSSTLAVRGAPGSATSEFERSYLHRSWDTEKGLPQSSVTAVVQTRDGYLWVGTLGGLARFDGASFLIFDTTNTPQLKSTRVRALAEDDHNDLWIGTELGGLTRYRKGSFQTFSQSNGLPSEVVISLASDRHGGMFIGTINGVAHWDGSHFTSLPANIARSPETINSLYVDTLGNLWEGTDKQLVVKVCRTSNGEYRAHEMRTIGSVLAIGEDRDGSVWVGTGSGLFKANQTSLQATSLPDGRSTGAVNSLYRDGAGTLWAGAAIGLIQVERGWPKLAAKLDGEGSGVVRSITSDREGSLWTGTDAQGLHQWTPSFVRSFGEKDGLTDRPIASVYQDVQSTIWIGSLGTGLFKYKGQKFEAVFTKPAGIVRRPASITADPSEHLWIGDWDQGLLRLAGRAAQTVKLPDLNDQVIRSEFVDSNGAVWIGTDHSGLYRLQNGTVKNYRTSSGLLSNVVVSISQSRDGHLWLGCPEGLSSFDGVTFRNYRHPELRFVRTIFEDTDGTLWIGTYGYGLFRWRAGQFSRITTNGGLFDVVVSAILPDRHGRLWMSGNRGIFCCRVRDLNEFMDGKRPKIECVAYGASDGLSTSETNGVGHPSALSARDGRLWFPLVKGIAAIDPDRSRGTAPPSSLNKSLLTNTRYPLNPHRYRLA